MPSVHQPRILFVEDEDFYLREFSKILQQEQYEVLGASGPDEAFGLMEGDRRIDLLLTDVRMGLGPDTQVSQIDARGGQWAGIAVAKAFRRRFPTAPIVFWTQAYDRETRAEARKIGNTRLFSKRQDALLLLDEISDCLEGIRSGNRPRIFIVHGHDVALLEEVKSLLTEGLGLPPPIVLKEEASRGITLIEKIENEALNIDLVIVLLTPDDRVISEDGASIHGRARQNVVFELGFFLGLLGRGQGRVVLLHKDRVELPSDIHGVLSIDVSEGLDSVLPELRRELEEWL